MAYDRQKNTERVARYRRGKPAAVKRQIARYEALNPEKRQAWNAVYNALRRGDLIKPGNCESCGETARIHAHHDDYAKPLDVVWLCAACHKALHLSSDGGTIARSTG